VISKPASALDAASAIAAHVEGRSIVSRPVTVPLARSRRLTRIA
jgi:hypothetical protein